MKIIPPTSISSRACGSFLSGKRNWAHARVRNSGQLDNVGEPPGLILLADFIKHLVWRNDLVEFTFKQARYVCYW